MNILITGASGLLGTELIRQLLPTKNKIHALTSKPENLAANCGNDISIHSINEWRDGMLSMSEINTVIHCAFARAHKGGGKIAEGLLFTSEVFNEIKNQGIKTLINISTQEVYGKADTPWIEALKVNPSTVYGTMKYFSELYAQKKFINSRTKATSLRLAGLIGVGADTRMVTKFVDHALNNKPLKIHDSTLLFSQLDIRDAASGIIALLTVSAEKWKPVYNLGYLQSYSIQEIANIVKIVGKEFNLFVKIIKETSDVSLFAELDSTLFYHDTNWQPKYNMEAMVRNIFENRLRGKIN